LVRGTTIERAVVVTVAVKGAALMPSRFTDVGETAQLVPLGCVPLQPQASATLPLKPVGAIWRL
jgi:hypothetical protein